MKVKQLSPQKPYEENSSARNIQLLTQAKDLATEEVDDELIREAENELSLPPRNFDTAPSQLTSATKECESSDQDQQMVYS